MSPQGRVELDPSLRANMCSAGMNGGPSASSAMSAAVGVDAYVPDGNRGSATSTHSRTESSSIGIVTVTRSNVLA